MLALQFRSFSVLLLVLLLSVNTKTKAQKITCEVYLLERGDVAAKIIAGQSLSDDELKDKTLLPVDRNQLRFLKGSDFVALKTDFLVIVFFKDGVAIPNGQVHLKTIAFSPNGKTLPNTFSDDAKGIQLFVSDGVNEDVKTKDIIEIAITTDEAKPFKFYFNMQNKTQNYGANLVKNVVGLWVPLNLYSGSIDRSENGVRFTAMPVSGAVGFKRYVSKDFYWGWSLMGNYTVASARKEDPSILIQALSAGVLLDIGGYGYVGYSIPFNFDSENRLKNQVVAGVTLRLGDLFRKEQQ